MGSSQYLDVDVGIAWGRSKVATWAAMTDKVKGKWAEFLISH